MKEMELSYGKRNLVASFPEHLAELLVDIQVILRVIPGETLVEFVEWMKRCIDMNGEYVG
jgi:hypothetical protein